MGRRINIFSVRQVRESSGIYTLDTTKVSSPDVSYRVIQEVLDLESSDVEKFGILTLNTRNHVAGLHIISVGTLDSSHVHPRDVFKAAILNNSAKIVIFHNHPSGDPEPSEQDKHLTQVLVDAGNLLSIQVLDHIVVGRQCFKSFQNSGLM